jgi:xanthine dehydrogenase FAD-binding subunit
LFRFSKLYEPLSLSEALTILAENPEAKIIAGGTDILLQIRNKKLSNVPLVSLQKIKTLHEINKTQDGSLKIGSMVSFNQIHKNEIINSTVPVLAQAAGTMGGPQIRNVATLGGNLCNGATSADSAPTLLALEAKLVIESLEGTREISIKSFYKGLYEVDIRPHEILTTIKIPSIDGNWGGYYTKFSMRKAMDISTLGCAVVCILHNPRSIKDIRIALGTAAPIPIRCYNAEKKGIGSLITEEFFQKLGLEAMGEAKPRTSWRASKEYRNMLIKELTSRTAKNAFLAAGGELSQ